MGSQPCHGFLEGGLIAAYTDGIPSLVHHEPGPLALGEAAAYDSKPDASASIPDNVRLPEGQCRVRVCNHAVG